MGRNMDKFGSDDMALPELKLAQATGEKPENAKPGDFFLSISDEVYAEGVNIVIIDTFKGRTYWGRTDLDNEPPECSSIDMETGKDGKLCAECEYRCDTPWLVDATARRTKCLVSYRLLVMNYDTRMPMMVRAGGISTAAVKEIYTLLRMNKVINGQYERAIIRLVSEKKKTGSGEAYALKFKLSSVVNDANEATELRLLSEQLLGQTLLIEEGETPVVAPDFDARPATAEARETQTISRQDVGKVPVEVITKVEGGKAKPPAPVDLNF